MNLSMNLIYQNISFFFIFLPTSNHLHPLQVENCDSNSRLVVDEDDNGKFRLERVKRNNERRSADSIRHGLLHFMDNTLELRYNVSINM